MKCNTLINILDDYNDDAAYISKFINPKKVVNIASECREPVNVLRHMKRFLSKQLDECEIIGKSYQNPLQLQKIIEEHIQKNTVINISSGDNLSAVLAYKSMIDMDGAIIYMDVQEEKIYELNARGIKTFNYNNIRFKVKDYISITGGEIVTDETVEYNNEDYYNMLLVILEDYDLWISTRDFIRNNTVSQTDDSIVIKTSEYDEDIKRLFTKFIDIGCVKRIVESDKHITIIFKNDEVRKYILSGIWLEYFTYNVIKENQKVWDVRSGVRFLWDKDRKEVENELDVIAVAGSQLLCISCKDTRRYNSGSLNELDIYAERIGGSSAKKILVATKPSKGLYVDERAKKMGINIIIFDGDVDKFKIQIDNIIEK